MKRTGARLLCLLLCLCLTVSGAWGLTPAELGEILENEYVGQIPDQVWAQTTVEDMLSALGDPFSHYYPPERYAGFLERANGQTESGADRYWVEDGIGHIVLNGFGQVDALRAWTEENAGAVEHWVVDLRGNRGGGLKSAAEAMGIFAGSGALVYLQDRAGKLYAARSEKSRVTMDPVVVLTGSYTASAGELYAAALRDRQVGLLIGSRTYGKGVAQTAFDRDHETYGDAFADGSGLLLSTERAFSEHLVSCNILGVLPHLMVADDQAEEVARLLRSRTPAGSTEGWLRLDLAHWRWYVEIKTADPAALRVLLEALPPQAGLYQGTGGAEGWRPVTAEDYGAAHIPGYTPRVFPDVAGSPYAGAINALKTYGILKGDGSGRYHPCEGLTRGELCALLAQAMDCPQSDTQPAFADTPADAWYTPYVTALSAMGLVNGCGDGLFHPEDAMDHQQFMTILARLAAQLSYKSAEALAQGPSAEALATGEYDAYDAWAVAGAWLLDGRWHADAVDIDPRATITREEAACDLWRVLASQGVLPV